MFAVRTVKTTGKSHLSVDGRPACGRTLTTPTETVPWDSTDPADRCAKCAR